MLRFFSFNTGDQYTVVLGLLPVFASVFSAHGHIGRFSVVFMSATLALAGRRIFRKQRFFEEAVPFRHVFIDARIHVMHVRG